MKSRTTSDVVGAKMDIKLVPGTVKDAAAIAALRTRVWLWNERASQHGQSQP